jgi:hypothetical protein
MTDTTKQVYTSGICQVCHQRNPVRKINNQIVMEIHNFKGTRIYCEGSGVTAPVKVFDQDGTEMRIMDDGACEFGE